MKSIGIDHIEINVSNLQKSELFYDYILLNLGYKKHLNLGEDIRGWYNSETKHGSIFIVQTEQNFIDKVFHRKTVGINHIAIRVSTKTEVDEFYNLFLKKSEISILYDGPKEYPEYHDDYYAVFFEDPDRIKIEVMHLNLN